MMRRLVLWAILSFALLGRAELSFYDGVAVYVNDKVITVETVLQQMRMNFDLSRVPPEELPGQIRQLFPVVRDLLIDRMLILKAYEDSGAHLPDEVVNERIKAIVAEEFDGNEAKLREALRKQRMTYDAWVKQVREDIIVQAMRQLQVGKKVSVSPKQVKLYFAEHMDDFAEEGGTHVRTILLTPDQGTAVAEEVQAALAAGTPFEEVARKYSADSQAAQGGDWGFVNPKEVFSPQIVEALAKLKPGEHSGILEASGYRSLVQKVEVKHGRRPSFTEAWPRVEAAVKNELGQARYNAWIESLRARAYIKVMDIHL